MAIINVLVISGPEGTVSLRYDNVALTWTGVRVVVTSPLRVYGLANGVVISQTIQPGTFTITFPTAVVLTSVTHFQGISFLQPSVRFELGAGSP